MRAIDSIVSEPGLRDDIIKKLGKLDTNLFSERELLEARDFLTAHTPGSTLSDEKRKLESIILLVGRPVIEILHSTFQVPSSDVWFDKLKQSRNLLESIIPSIGRVETTNVPGFEWLGTAWIVKEDIIVTNAHVAREFAKKNADNKFEFRRNFKNERMRARLDTREEFDQSEEIEYIVTDILYVAEPEDIDLALMKVKPMSDDGVQLPAPIQLSSNKLESSVDVAVIGYPARDSRAVNADMEKVFGNIFDVKRLSPGIASPTQWDGILSHDCSTLGGNSGSPLISLSSGEAIGIHFKGGTQESGNNAISSTHIKSLLDRLGL
jgi:endonuclease G